MSTSASSIPSTPDIKSLLAEFDASGQSVAAFARSRGIATWKLYHAVSRRSGKLRRRRGAAHHDQPVLLPVRVVETQSAKPSPGLELLLAGGHRLLISTDFDAELLRRVLGALASC